MSERAVFDAALQRTSPRARRAYLDEACAGDPALRRRVEVLLAAHARAGGFLERPPLLPAAPIAESSGETTEPWTPPDEPPPEHPPHAPEPADETVAEEALETETVALDFLEAPTRPGSLGRLAHYDVREVLGLGGFGIVLKAYDEKLQRLVAVKVLGPRLAGSGTARKRFLREARAAAAVRNEHVVSIHAIEDHPLPYIVMEYVAGRTLQQRLERDGPLEVREILRIGAQVAEGLAAAHRQGLTHRDVKPGNILLEDGVERVKITDFGLARAADDGSLTQSGLIAGTPAFMAPEQARGEPIDHRADLFSLGSVLYTMCTGCSPFRAPSTIAILKRVCDDDPRPIREINPEIPDWLAAIVARLQAKKPEDRFATAREVADLLSECLAQWHQHGTVETVLLNLPAAPQPEPLPAPAPATKPGRRWWIAAAAVLALGLLGAGLAEATGLTHLAGTVIRMVRPEGTLVIEVDDPGVSVSIDGEQLVITGAGAREIRIRPGRHTVRATKGGRVLKQEIVSVVRDGRQIVKVTQEGGAQGLGHAARDDEAADAAIARARAAARDGRWDDVEHEATAALEAVDADWTGILRVWGEVLRLCEHYDGSRRAAGLLERATAGQPDLVGWQYHACITALGYGDLDAYRRAYPRLARLADALGTDGFFIANVINFGPEAGADRDLALRLARLSAAALPDQPYAQQMRAHAEFLAGHYDEALHALQKRDDVGSWLGPVSGDLMRAMIHARTGHADEARVLLSKAERWDREYLTETLTFPSPVGGWVEWLQFKLLLRQARRVVSAASGD
jgi:tetratricopeptide (TPR) repeat protein